MNLKKRVFELRSMIEELPAGGRDVELWRQTLSVIDEMANRIERICLNQAKILDYMEALDDDLSMMESQLNNPGASDDDDEGYDLGSTEGFSNENKSEDT